MQVSGTELIPGGKHLYLLSHLDGHKAHTLNFFFFSKFSNNFSLKIHAFSEAGAIAQQLRPLVALTEKQDLDLWTLSMHMIHIHT